MDTPTAEDFYVRVLATLGVSENYYDYSPEFVARFLEQYPDLSEREVRGWMDRGEIGPAVKFRAHLEDLLSRLPNGDRALFQDVYVGEVPLTRMNARSVTTPTGGVVVLVNRGLSKTLYEWSKVLGNLAAHPNQEEQLLARWKESVERYLATGTEPTFPDLLNAEANPMIVVSQAAIEFVIAHELAHVILGSSPTFGDVVEGGALGNYPLHEREEEADSLALEIFLWSETPDYEAGSHSELMAPLEVRLSGVMYVMMMTHTLEMVEVERPDQFYGRLGRFKAHVERRLGHEMSQYPLTNVTAKWTSRLQEAFVPNPPVAELDPEVAFMNRVYVAHKAGDLRLMSGHMATAPEATRYWTRLLAETAVSLAAGNRWEFGFDWGDGDAFNAADLFDLLFDMSAASGGSIVLGDFGANLARLLERSAADFERRGGHGAAADKRRQAKRIEGRGGA